MITRAFLEEYEENKKNYIYELKKLDKQIKLESRKTTVDSVRGSSRVFPYVERHYSIGGVDTNKIKKLEKRKSIFQKKIKKLDKQIKYELDNLSDRMIADIIEQKFVQDKSWGDIAMCMNYSDESGARNALKRFLEKQ